MPPKAEKKNNGFDRLRADLKAQTPQNVYLFYGEETYLRSYYLEELHRLLIPAGFEEFNYHRLSGKGLTVQELAEVTEAMPMMAQHTMVVVTDLDIFRLDEQQRTALMALLADFPEYCTLVLVYDLLPYKRDGKMKKLCAALDKSVCEVEFRQQERAQLLRWVKRRFAAAGHDIDDATADHLLFTCGSLMTELVPEIGKIAAYAKGRAVTVEDINAVADPVLDARVFDMTNSITAGKYDQAAQVLGELLRMQTEPIVILAAVGKELRRLYTARMALDAGKDRFWLKQLWSMSSDYPAKLLMQAAGKVDHEWCQTAVIRCQRLDRRMKSEKNMDSEAELKLFLMELAGSREAFIREMERRGYRVRWEDARKCITYTTPTGMRCRDNRLHEEKFRKEKMEHEFRIRQHAAQQRTRSIEAEAENLRHDAYLDGAAAQHPLHHASPDGGAAGGRPAENTGTPRDDPGRYGAAGYQGESEVTGYFAPADWMAERDQPSSSEVPTNAGRDGHKNERATETGWESARRIYEAALRAGQGIPGGWRGADEYLPEMGGPHHPEFCGGGPGDQHPDLQAADVTKNVLRLLARLEGNPGEDVVDATMRRQHGDRKALAREQRKKIALGHKADDHEQGQQMG